MALLAEQYIPRMCFVYSVAKLFLQPAVKHLAPVCIRMIQKKKCEREFRENESQALLFYSASLFCS